MTVVILKVLSRNEPMACVRFNHLNERVMVAVLLFVLDVKQFRKSRAKYLTDIQVIDYQVLT